MLTSLFPRTLQLDPVSISRFGLNFQCNLTFSKLTWTFAPLFLAQWAHGHPDLAWTFLGFYDFQNLLGTQDPLANALPL